MPYKSKAQWKWAFANKKPFARRWAHHTKSYKSLPAKRKRRKTTRKRSRRRGRR